jgi:hypothetical protein
MGIRQRNLPVYLFTSLPPCPLNKKARAGVLFILRHALPIESTSPVAACATAHDLVHPSPGGFRHALYLEGETKLVAQLQRHPLIHSIF